MRLNPKISAWWILLPLLLFFGREAISMLVTDNTAKIARVILHQPQALGAAVNMQFPRGSPSSEFEAFIQTLQGQCIKLSNGQLSCFVVEEGTICVVNKMLFKAHLSTTGTIENIEVERRSAYC